MKIWKTWYSPRTREILICWNFGRIYVKLLKKGGCMRFISKRLRLSYKVIDE